MQKNNINLPITYTKLSNGLRAVVAQDHSSPVATVAVFYQVGFRSEIKGRTGFAHLFEHLMFSGTKKIPNFDTFLENVGAQNNAFTNNDITNYYITIPPNNLEYALCAESDRMLGLAFSQNNLDITNMPYHSEILEFSNTLAELTGLQVLDDSKPSRVALIGKEKIPLPIPEIVKEF